MTSWLRFYQGTPHVLRSCKDQKKKKAFRHSYSNRFALTRRSNPLTGQEEDVLTYLPSEGKIVLKVSQVPIVVKAMFAETKGEGARKILTRMRELYVGVKEVTVQKVLNELPEKQKIKPRFLNKPPSRPVEASEVMERNQIDLIDFQGLPVEHEGITYNFVLSVMDVFSRYVFLAALPSKHAHNVAHELYQLYSVVGPPRIIQCDQGGKFKGVVKVVADKLNVKIVRSRPYHPQSQGKVCVM